MSVFNRKDIVLDNAIGQALGSALVYVCTQPAVTNVIPPSPLATLYSDSTGTALANPITIDGLGNGVYYAAAGTYTEVYVFQGKVVKILPDQALAVANASSLTDGTNAAPSLFFANETGLGVYRPSSGLAALVSDVTAGGLGINKTADTFQRVAILNDATIHFGSGSGATDVTLSRTSDPNAVLGLSITQGSVFGVAQFAGNPNTTSWGAGQKGRLWFNTSSNSFQYWDGTTVTSLAGPNAVFVNQANTYASGNIQAFLDGTNFEIKNVAFTSKIAKFDLSNITTSNTRTMTVPDANCTLVVPSTASTHNFATAVSGVGVITYSQPAVADLSDTKTGSGNLVLATSPTLTTPNIGVASGTSLALSSTVITYNNISTVSNGVPSILATVDLATQGADISATTMYAVPSTGAGMYVIHGYAVVTRAATSSSTLPAINVTYTDKDTSQVVTTTIATTYAGNATGVPTQGGVVINAKASTNIQYVTSGFATSGATSMQFAAHWKVKCLG